MTATFVAEFRRALARRMFLVLLLLAVAGIAVGGIVTFLQTEDRAGPPIRRLEFQGKEVRKCIESGRAPDGTVIPPEERSRECRLLGLRSVTADPRFKLTDLISVFLGTSVVLVIGSWLVGASFIGAEWHTGNITTVLTWEPRRVRLFVTKLAACLTVVAGAALVLHLLLGLALTPTAAFKGTTAGMDGEWWREVTSVVLRVTALAALGCVLGFSVAAIGRNTAAALGVGFAYLAIVENLVRALKPEWGRWLITDNAFLFLSGESPGLHFTGRGVAGAGVVLACYAGGLFVVACLLFRARDVT